jgi:hypothetical protein
MKQHQRNISLYQTDKSALAVHVWEERLDLKIKTKLLKYITNSENLIGIFNKAVFILFIVCKV